MGRRNKKNRKRRNEGGAPSVSAPTAEVPVLEAEALSGRGKKTIAGGIGLLVVGFVILTFTDPDGQNWASMLSPLLILGAYGIIAAGIFIPDAEGGAPTPVASVEQPTTEEPPTSN
jgi:hypothetical protein